MGLLSRVEGRRLADGPVELATVLFGEVGRLDEGVERALHVGGGENEDFGGGDGIEPAFYPAPDGGEEGGSADDLEVDEVD